MRLCNNKVTFHVRFKKNYKKHGLVMRLCNNKVTFHDRFKKQKQKQTHKQKKTRFSYETMQ